MTYAQALKAKVTPSNARAVANALRKQPFTDSDLKVYAANRLQALANDKENRKAGRSARVYLNRKPSRLPKKIRAAYAKVAEAVTEMRESTVH